MGSSTIVEGRPRSIRALQAESAPRWNRRISAEFAIEPVEFAADGFGDDAVDRGVEGLAGLIAAEGSQAVYERSIKPHRDRLPRGVFGAHLLILAQSDLHQQAE
jgi:hypothetical protein